MMITSTAWTAVGWTMLHFLWVGSILGALAVIGRLLLRRAKAEVQYIYGLGCLAILAMTPVVIAGSLLFERSAVDIGPREAAPLPAISGSIAGSADQVRVGPLIVPEPVPLPAAVSWAGEAPLPFSGMRVMASLALYLPYIWLVGVPITFTYLALGLAGAERLRGQSVLIVDPELSELARRLAEALGVARRVVLATCERLSSPVLVGIVRPTILLPAAALTGWSPDQLEMALLHELVHVRRWDNLVILLQRLIESTLFFHPVVWIVSGWVHREREHCCDEAVVRYTGRPVAYAEVLLALTEKKPSRGPAVVAMAEGDLVARVRRLLSPQDHSMKLPRITIALTMGLLLLPALLIGSRAAFSGPDDPSPKAVANEAPGTRVAEDANRDRSRDQAVRQVADEAVKAFIKSADKRDSAMFLAVARAQATIGDRAGALETVRQAARVAAEVKQTVIRQGNSVSYGISSAEQLARVGRLQSELGDRQGALETLRLALLSKDDQEADGSRIETLAALAKELTALNAPEEAREVAKQADREVEAMGKRAQAELVLPQLAAAHLAAGDINAAFGLLERVGNSTRSDRLKQFIIGRTLGLMAKATDTANRVTAQTRLDRILRKLDEVPVADDKYYALHQTAYALAKTGAFESAMHAARLIGKGPSNVNYDMRDGQASAMCVIAAEQRKARNVEGARGTLREAYEVAKAIDESRGKSSRLSEVAAGMTAVGDISGALRCIDDMQPGQRFEILSYVGIAQKNGGNPKAARDTFLRAIEDAKIQRANAPRPGADAPANPVAINADDGVSNTVITKGIAKIEARMGNFAEARKTAESIPDPLWRAAALADVAHAQAAAGDARAALDWSLKQDRAHNVSNPFKAVVEGIAEYVQARSNRLP